MRYVKRGEIVANHRHHGVGGTLAREGSHSGSGFSLRAGPNSRHRLADRLEIVAGVETIGNGSDVFAQGLAVPQEGGAGEHVHLGASVVDVVLARSVPAGEEQTRQGVAEDRAASMPDMHGPGRIGAHILDIDRPVLASRARAVPVALG